jgi:hypothetical protein
VAISRPTDIFCTKSHAAANSQVAGLQGVDRRMAKVFQDSDVSICLEFARSLYLFDEMGYLDVSQGWACDAESL